MKKFKLGVALLIALAFGATIGILHEQNHALARQLNEKTNQLSSSQTELKQIQIRLAVAERQLGFLEKYKTAVQVTAYTRSSQSTVFADGKSVTHAYSVPQHTLPEDRVVNVALSPTAAAKLHARMNDYLVLIHKRSHRQTIARFVDLTSPAETRPVVDVFFTDARQAILWGRRSDYYAVNISMLNSPFKGVLGD
jgi:hypothetical protein